MEELLLNLISRDGDTVNYYFVDSGVDLKSAIEETEDAMNFEIVLYDTPRFEFSIRGIWITYTPHENVWSIRYCGRVKWFANLREVREVLKLVCDFDRLVPHRTLDGVLGTLEEDCVGKIFNYGDGNSYEIVESQDPTYECELSNLRPAWGPEEDYMRRYMEFLYLF